MAKCILDYLSFTFSPEPLQQLKALAKQGAALKRDKEITALDNDQSTNFLKALAARETVREFDLSSSAYCDADASRELRDMLNMDYELTGKPYHDALSDLCEHVGYGMIDAICHGEIDQFIASLNRSISCKFSQAEWTIRERQTGRFKYSHSADCMYRSNPITDSAPIRSLIPEQTDH